MFGISESDVKEYYFIVEAEKTHAAYNGLGLGKTFKLPEDMSVAYVFGLDRVMRMLEPRLVEYSREHKRKICVVSKAFEFKGRKPIAKHGAFYLYEIEGQGDEATQTSRPKSLRI